MTRIWLNKKHCEISQIIYCIWYDFFPSAKDTNKYQKYHSNKAILTFEQIKTSFYHMFAATMK